MKWESKGQNMKTVSSNIKIERFKSVKNKRETNNNFSSLCDASG